MNNSTKNSDKEQTTTTCVESQQKKKYDNWIISVQKEKLNERNITYLYFEAKDAKKYYPYLSRSEQKDFLIKYKNVVIFYYCWLQDFNNGLTEKNLKNKRQELYEIQQLNQEIREPFIVLCVIAIIIIVLLFIVLFIVLLISLL